MASAARAQAAFGVTGYKIAVTPPPVYSGQHPRIGLAQVAFAHEDEIFRVDRSGFGGLDHKSTEEMTIDALVQAGAVLELEKKTEIVRRRKPFYWPDRVLRSILGFPAYLISLVFGFDLGEVSGGKGRMLWLLAIGADIAGIVGLGDLIGWWDVGVDG